MDKRSLTISETAFGQVIILQVPTILSGHILNLVNDHTSCYTYRQTVGLQLTIHVAIHIDTCGVTLWTVFRQFIRSVSTVISTVTQSPGWNTAVVILTFHPATWTRVTLCKQIIKTSASVITHRIKFKTIPINL